MKNVTSIGLWSRIIGLLNKHSIMVAGVVIFGYYLLTSVDIMVERSGQKIRLLDYAFQFDSLILLWVIAVVVVKLQTYRKKLKDEEDFKRRIVTDYERQRAHLQILDDITNVLNDTINNPLAVITVSIGSLRQKYQLSSETVETLNMIESAARRIRQVLNEIKGYQTEKIVGSPRTPAADSIAPDSAPEEVVRANGANT
jgi:signal transduction histidine kinase